MRNFKSLNSHLTFLSRDLVRNHPTKSKNHIAKNRIGATRENVAAVTLKNSLVVSGVRLKEGFGNDPESDEDMPEYEFTENAAEKYFHAGCDVHLIQ